MNRTRFRVLTASTVLFWTAISLPAMAVLVLGTAWAMSTIVYEAVAS